MNILGAQIYLKKDGIVIVTLQVEASTKADAEDLETWKDIKNSLSQLFKGETSLQEMLKSRIRYAGVQKKMAMVPRVHVERTAGNSFTEIRVEARDHIGMLYKVSAVFADFGIRIPPGQSFHSRRSRHLMFFMCLLETRVLTSIKLSAVSKKI